MNSLKMNPRTTVGGIIALATVFLLAVHTIDMQNALILLGIAGAWVGITGADAGKGTPQ